MKAVITVVGKDRVGILAEVSSACAKCNCNIVDVSQSVLGDMFCMIMLAEIDNSNIPFSDVCSSLEKLGDDMGLKIHCMHEDIFNAMHKI